MALARFSRALVRGLPATFPDALAFVPTTIDMEAARAQQEAYIGVLKDLGLRVAHVPADDRYAGGRSHGRPSAARRPARRPATASRPCPADCVFIEDTAIVVDSARAVLARPGAHERLGEQEDVARALTQAGLAIAHAIEAPGTLDGGDVLQVRG
jgi:N-dimethylarginine dimethylaminohydrolase